MIKIVLTAIISIFLFSACSSKKITIKSLQPSKITNKKIHTIKVNNFLNDKIFQKYSLENQLSNKIIENKKLFLLKNNYNVDALIDGKVLESSVFYDTYYDEETDYSRCRYYKYDKERKKRYCAEYKVKFIPCVRKDYKVLTHIKITNPQTQNVLFSNTYEENHFDDECYKYRFYPYHHFPIAQTDEYKINSKLAQIISKKIVDDISVHYEYLEIPIIEDFETKNLKLSKNQKQRFEIVANFISKGKLNLAKLQLEKLDKELDSKSAEVLYNLALIYEARNSLQRANSLYTKSKTLTKDLKHLELINKAIIRTKINLENRIKAKSQLP